MNPEVVLFVKIVASVVGSIITVPTLIAIVKFIVFLTKLDGKLDILLDWKDSMNKWKHDTVNDALQEHEARLDVHDVEIKHLKESAA